MKTTTSSVDETRRFGAEIAAQAQPGDCYVLEGELGAGKTEFVRGFVASLGPVDVRSPSFAILNIYDTDRYSVYHFDFYRLADASELTEIGFDDYASSPEGVCLIEWGTLFPEVLPENAKILRFTDIGEGRREIEEKDEG